MKTCLYGKVHQFTASAIGSIARILYKNGAHKEALEMWKQALSIYKKVLVDNHHRTIGACKKITMISSKIENEKN